MAMTRCFVTAALALLSTFGLCGGSALDRPAVLDYCANERPVGGVVTFAGSPGLKMVGSVPIGRSFAQEPAPAPDFYVLMDLAYSSSGKFHQINRVERRFRSLGNGLYTSLSTGSGWRLEDGVPVGVPLGFFIGGEVPLDFLVIVLGIGADLVLPQNEKIGFEASAKLAVRFAW